MINSLLQKIKQGYLSLVSDDTNAYPQAECVSMGKRSKFIRLSVYGICSNPPEKSHILLLSGQGGESDKFGICNDYLGRMKGLKEGEVALFNTKSGSYVLLKADGGIDVSGDEISITGNVAIDGTLDVSGAITTPDEVTAGAVPVTLTGHVHPITQPNGTPSGAGVG